MKKTVSLVLTLILCALSTTPSFAAEMQEIPTVEDLWYELDISDGAYFCSEQKNAWFLTDIFSQEGLREYGVEGGFAYYAPDGTKRTAQEQLQTGDILKMEDAGGAELYSAPVVFLMELDGDGAVTSCDARLALLTAAKQTDFDRAHLLAADADGSRHVGAADARVILRVAARLERRVAVWSDFENRRLQNKLVLMGIFTDEKKELETPQAVLEELEKGGLSPQDREFLEKSFRRVTYSWAFTPEVIASNTGVPPEAVPNETNVFVQLTMDARRDYGRIIAILEQNDRVDFAERDSVWTADEILI